MTKRTTARPSRTRSRTTASARRRGAEAGGIQATVRHYCQGIGDCHLLKFKKDNGEDFWMLIDCGVHSAVSGGPQKIDAIVDDIAATTKRLDVIVATHEHTDHLSGFLTAAEKFGKLKVGEVWMAWTENPADPQARALDKYKDQALAALQTAGQALDGASRPGPHLATVRDGLQSVLGFQFGAKGDRVRAMRDAVVALAPSAVRYLEPKDAPLTIKDLANLRIYVLGPPRDPNLIKIVERPGEMYGLAGDEGWPIAQSLANAFAANAGALSVADDFAAPFDLNVGADLTRVKAQSAPAPTDPDHDLIRFVHEHYFGPGGAGAGNQQADQSWRRIDADWLGITADLAMQLDKRTNNSSLVLAFEFVDTGRVMLFVGDAQVGNWLSWQDVAWRVGDATVRGPDLLARTVFYKVGHHGSHNATLRQKGLELMTQQDLAAFIPTNEKDAKKVKWGAMPFRDIVDELDRRGSHRVIRADDAWIATDTVKAGFTAPSGSIRGLRHKRDLYVELDIA